MLFNEKLRRWRRAHMSLCSAICLTIDFADYLVKAGVCVFVAWRLDVNDIVADRLHRVGMRTHAGKRCRKGTEHGHFAFSIQ